MYQHQWYSKKQNGEQSTYAIWQIQCPNKAFNRPQWYLCIKNQPCHNTSTKVGHQHLSIWKDATFHIFSQAWCLTAQMIHSRGVFYVLLYQHPNVEQFVPFVAKLAISRCLLFTHVSETITIYLYSVNVNIIYSIHINISTKKWHNIECFHPI